MAKIDIKSEKTYNLSLSPEELVTLFVLVGEVYGDPNNSPRKYTESIYCSIEHLFKGLDIPSFGLSLESGFETDSLSNEDFQELVKLVK